MKRLSMFIVGVLLIALPAIAKGPTSATVDGPGIDEPILVNGHYDGPLGGLVDSIGYYETVYGSATGLGAEVVGDQPAGELGPEYVVGVTQIGPAGDAYFPVSVYPLAEGGPLVHAEPGILIEEMQTESTGGWYRTPHDVVAVFESLGVVWPTVEKVTVVDEPELVSVQPIVSESAAVESNRILPILGILAGILFLVMLWVVWRRPRRLSAS